MKHLVYTSARRGLDSNYAGFCTVAASPGFSPPIRKAIENLSGYSPEGGDSGSYPNYSHMKLRTREGVKHLISRIAPCAPDYSGRSNTIAHHILFEAHEENSLDPLAYIMPDVLFYENWIEEPRTLDEHDIGTRNTPEPLPCTSWAKFTGDAGNAGVAWMTLRDHAGPVLILVPQNADRLTLLREFLALIPPDARRHITFSTAPGADHSSMTECRLRMRIDCPESRKECAELRGAAILDFTQPRAAAHTTEAECARNGRPFEANIQPETLSTAPIQIRAIPVHAKLEPSPTIPATFSRARHRTPDNDTTSREDGNPISRALMFAATFALGVGLTLVIRAVIPTVSVQSDAKPAISSENSIASNRTQDAGSMNDETAAATKRSLDEMKEQFAVQQNKLQSSERIITELEQSVRRLSAALNEANEAQLRTAPPAPAAEPFTNTQDTRSPETQPIAEPVQLSIEKDLGEPIKIFAPGPGDGSTVACGNMRFTGFAKVALESDDRFFELKSTDGFKIELHRKNPIKSASQRVMTISLTGGQPSELRLDRDPSASGDMPQQLSVKLMNDEGDVIRVRLKPMSAVECELKSVDQGVWRAELDPSHDALLDSIFTSFGTQGPIALAPKGISGFTYSISRERIKNKTNLKVEFQPPTSLDFDDQPTVNSMSERIKRLRERLDQAKSDLKKSEDKSALKTNAARELIHHIDDDVNAMALELDHLKAIIPATTAFHKFFDTNQEWIIPSNNADGVLIIRLSKDGR